MVVRTGGTTDHGEIRHWVEERGGVPSLARGMGADQQGTRLRIHFPQKGQRSSQVERISWDDWFDVFEREQLAIQLAENPKSHHYAFMER